MPDNSVIFADRIIGSLIAKEKYRLVDHTVLAEVVRDAVHEIENIRSTVIERRGANRAIGPTFIRPFE